MKKLFLITIAFLLSLGVMAQTNADRTLQLYYGGEIIYSRALSLLDSLNFKIETIEEDDNSIGIENGHEWVDLGLPSGTKWATMNVGATSPERYGSYYAWGEIEPKLTYDWSTYKWCNGNYNSILKYCINSNNGKVDYKTIIELFDDVANKEWGGRWRIPTKEEQDELLNNCTWSWSVKNGINGYTVIGPNGNSIFMPMAGCYRGDTELLNVDSVGYYWSSSLVFGRSNDARGFYLGMKEKGYTYYDRCYGQSIRPVLASTLTHTINFEGNNGEGMMSSINMGYAETFIIPESKFTRFDYKFIGWNSEPDASGVSYSSGQIITISDDITLYAQWYKNEVDIQHEYVDLGLPSGTKWATCNIGASSPEDYGDYFAWGEISTKSNYTSSTYTFTELPNILPLTNDVANVLWGSGWHIPTNEEQDELLNTDYCIWTWTTLNGVNGYEITSKINGNSIFLPAAGSHGELGLWEVGYEGNYWSSCSGWMISGGAIGFGFDSTTVYGIETSCYNGQSVRPVLSN